MSEDNKHDDTQPLKPGRSGKPAGETSDKLDALEASLGAREGRRIGQYEIIEELGRGGMGIVFKARDAALDREVALKILPPHLASDEGFVRRFVREARAAAQLDHSGIVQVFQVAKAGNLLYIAMQLVTARPLSDIIREEGPQDPDYALSIIRQVAEALLHAHQKGIIHRDIKPSNILVSDDRRVKVMDFGLAKHLATGDTITKTGSYIGTPEYSSPEQCETQTLDQRTDIYSLGVVLYEMLTGRVPFKGETPYRLFEKILYEEPEPLSSIMQGLPGGLDRLAARMMAKNREDRYRDCAELLKDIDRLERGQSIRSVRRKSSTVPAKALFGVLAAFAVAAAISVPALFLLEDPSKHAPDAHAIQPQPDIMRETHASGTPERARHVVAVRDFDNATGRDDLDWLKVGLADMLITDLVGIDEVDVLSRMALSGKTEQTRSADIEVKGAFAEVGGRILINVQVLDLHSGTVLRAVRETASEQQIFDLIDAVSSSIRSGLQALLSEHLREPLDLTSADANVADRLLVTPAHKPKTASPAASTERKNAVAKDRETLTVSPRSAPPAPSEAGLRSAKPARRSDKAPSKPPEPGHLIEEKETVAEAGAAPPGAPEDTFSGDRVEAGKAKTNTVYEEADVSSKDGTPVEAGSLRGAGADKGAPAPAASKPEEERPATRKKALRRSTESVLLDAVRLRYKARLIIEQGPDRKGLEKALGMLGEAKEIAPNLKGLDDDIAHCRSIME